MAESEQKILQYLNEARASELALVDELSTQIAMTPRGPWRSSLEKHLGETRDHAQRVQERLRELGEGGSPLQAVVGLAEAAIGQSLALSRAPLTMLRGRSGEEKLLKNAKDAAASEALEIATYLALERVARAVGDSRTAELAASIRGDEERMLQRVLREIPKLAGAVVGAEVEGDSSYDVFKTGAADTVREVGRTARKSATKAGTRASSQAKKTARQARKVPGVTRAEGEAKGAVASQGDLPIAGYDDLTADDVVGKLTGLSQVDLGKVDAYERRHQNRTTVTDRIESLRGDEPWPGYDELNVDEVRTALEGADEERIKTTRTYERAHKDRAGVIEATERQLTNA